MPQFLIESILVAPFLRNSCDGESTGENGVSGFDPGLEFRKLRLFGIMRVVCFTSFITITLELDSCWKPSFEELSFSIWCIDMDFSDITFGREWVLFYQFANDSGRWNGNRVKIRGTRGAAKAEPELEVFSWSGSAVILRKRGDSRFKNRKKNNFFRRRNSAKVATSPPVHETTNLQFKTKSEALPPKTQ